MSQTILQPPPLYPFSHQLPDHRRILVFPVYTIIIGEDYFVIPSREFGIVTDSCLQCVFQSLVNSDFLESIILFSN